MTTRIGLSTAVALPVESDPITLEITEPARNNASHGLVRRRDWDVVDRAEEAGGIGAIAVLGAAFKPESDDVRDSPALSVAGQLALRGASVSSRSAPRS